MSVEWFDLFLMVEISALYELIGSIQGDILCSTESLSLKFKTDKTDVHNK